ncbi:benzoylformate decarboxylase [Agrobacterium sp. 22-209-1]
MTTVQVATFELLRAKGLTTIFGNPGSNELHFLKGFPSDFRYVLGLHEGVVLGMADGFAQATRSPAFVNLHAAAGTGNAMGALTNAIATHSPLVVTAGQQVRTTMGYEPMLTNVDAPSLPRPLVKWSYEPASAQDVPRALSQAIHMASLAPTGPVYVSIPYDDWAEEAADQNELLNARRVSNRTLLPADEIESIAARLKAARNPVLVVGTDVDAAAAQRFAANLAEKQAMSVWIAPRPARLGFPTTHPNFRGVLPTGMASISRILSQHDLVLVVGAPVFRYHQHEPGLIIADGTELIHITCDPAEAARAPVGDAYVADIALTLEAIAELATRTDRPAPPRRPKPAPAAKSSEQAVHPEQVFDILAEVAPRDAIYVDESTSTTNELWDRLPMEEPGSYYFPGAGGLGFGIPVALGVQLACPDRRVIGVIGDGSANFAITGLWTAAQENIPAIFIIMKNGTYGALRWFANVLQAQDVPGLDVPGIDFCALANAYGIKAASVSTPEDFRSVLGQALEQSKPMLIEVTTSIN